MEYDHTHHVTSKASVTYYLKVPNFFKQLINYHCIDTYYELLGSFHTWFQCDEGLVDEDPILQKYTEMGLPTLRKSPGGVVM